MFFLLIIRPRLPFKNHLQTLLQQIPGHPPTFQGGPPIGHPLRRTLVDPQVRCRPPAESCEQSPSFPAPTFRMTAWNRFVQKSAALAHSFVHSFSKPQAPASFCQVLWLTCLLQPIRGWGPGPSPPPVVGGLPVICAKTGAPKHPCILLGAAYCFQKLGGWPGRLLEPSYLVSCSQSSSCPPGC